jgi:hypothetical protein
MINTVETVVVNTTENLVVQNDAGTVLQKNEEFSVVLAGQLGPPGNISVGPVAPANPYIGQLWVDTN